MSLFSPRLVIVIDKVKDGAVLEGLAVDLLSDLQRTVHQPGTMWSRQLSGRDIRCLAHTLHSPYSEP